MIYIGVIKIIIHTNKKTVNMADVDVYLKYSDGLLSFSNSKEGIYKPVEETTITCLVKRKDVINWYALDGIKKIKKIKRCGGAKCFKGEVQYPSNDHACVTVSENSMADDEEKYDIKFKADNGYIVLVDPKTKVNNPPD